MRTACVFALLLACASWDVAAYVSDSDAASSCHEAILLEDTASLLQVKAQTAAIEQASLQGGSFLRDFPIKERHEAQTGVCPPGFDMLWGEDCPTVDPDDHVDTTTPAPFCVDGKTASGKDCGGKVKIKTMTLGATRPCETASGDACEGEFQKKIRQVYQDKGGEWVMIRREQSQDGGKTWSPLPMSLAELATFTLTDEEASALIPKDTCCVPTTTPLGVCPAGTYMASGDDCPRDEPDINPDDHVDTTTPAPFCVDGKTASGKDCQGKVKVKTMTLPISRPCQTAAGDDCEGEFKKKIRETYEQKDGEWVMFKREQSQDGGKTWSALPMSLAERASSLSDEEASALIPKDSCCLPEKRIETCPDYQENGHGDPQFCPQWKTIMVNAQKTCKDKDATLSAGASKFTDCLCPQMCKEVDALKAAGWPKETSEHIPMAFR